MPGSPWLAAPGGEGETGRQRLQLLPDVVDPDAVPDPFGHPGPEHGLHLLAHDEHELAEACLEGVVDRIVEEDLAGRAEGRNLLDAAESPADPGGEDNKRRARARLAAGALAGHQVLVTFCRPRGCSTSNPFC